MHSKDTSVHSSHIGVQSLAFVHKPLSVADRFANNDHTSIFLGTYFVHYVK